MPTETLPTPQNPTPSPSLVSVNNLVPTAQQTYSPGNVAQTFSAPATKPDLSDPFGLYDYYLNSSEIQGAKSELQGLQQQTIGVNQALRTTTRALEGQNENAMGGTGASVNLIGKQVGRARQLTADELSALSEQQLVKQSALDSLMRKGTDLYGIAQSERGRLQELIAATGGRAGISYTDTFESAVKKADKYQEKKADEDRDKAYKDALKQQLLSLGSKTKGLSKNELEKKLRKINKNAVEEAKRVSDLSYNSSLLAYNKLKEGLNTGGGDPFSTSLENW